MPYLSRPAYVPPEPGTTCLHPGNRAGKQNQTFRRKALSQQKLQFAFAELPLLMKKMPLKKGLTKDTG